MSLISLSKAAASEDKSLLNKLICDFMSVLPSIVFNYVSLLSSIFFSLLKSTSF